MQDPEPWAVFERSLPGWWRVTGDFPTIDVATAIVGGRLRVIGLLAAEPENPAKPFSFRAVPVARIEASLAARVRGVEWAQKQSSPHSPMGLRQQLDRIDPGTPESPSCRSRAAIQPPSRPVPSEFYADVALAYREYSQQTTRPTVEIAREAGVGLRTAQGWVAEARRRQHLPPGQRGRVM